MNRQAGARALDARWTVWDPDRTRSRLAHDETAGRRWPTCSVGVEIGASCWLSSDNGPIEAHLNGGKKMIRVVEERCEVRRAALARLSGPASIERWRGTESSPSTGTAVLRPRGAWTSHRPNRED